MPGTSTPTSSASEHDLKPTPLDSEKKDVKVVGEAKIVEAGEAFLSEELKPGLLSLEEDSAGGMGRHLGLFSTTFLVVGRIIGTGIFSTPSSILSSVGSVGASMMLWTLGGILSACGLAVWLELACIYPRSGGEKVYLEAIYRRPRLLTTVLYAANAILLGFTAAGCIVFSANILTAAHVTVSVWNERGIAVGVIVFVTLIHGLTPKWGVRLMNVLGIFKVVLLLIVVVSGWVVLGGHVSSVPDPMVNFRNGFSGSSGAPYNYASSMFKVLNSCSGWANAAYVLNEVRNPVRTIRIAAPLGLAICTILYIFANLSYFSVLSLPDLKASGVTVASYYFLTVFGSTAQRFFSVGVALSALGNVLTVTFAQSRVNQELAKEGILPFTSFWSSNWPFGAPLPGLIVHLVPSVIIILDVEGYPGQIINLFVVIGLLYLRWKHPEIVRPFKAYLVACGFFFLAAIFLLVMPFISPPGGIGDTPPIGYYVYPLAGICIFVFGALYWTIWTVIMPRFGKYTLEPEKIVLEDGTVTTQWKKLHLE